MKIPRDIRCDWAVPFQGCGGSFFFQLALFLSYLLFFSLPFSSLCSFFLSNSFALFLLSLLLLPLPLSREP